MAQHYHSGNAQEEAEGEAASLLQPPGWEQVTSTPTLANSDNPALWLDRLCFGQVTELDGIRLAIVVAHPDDECIGAGAQLCRWKNAHIIYVTDGAPRNPRALREAGFPSREAYAQARRGEARAALGLAGLAWEQTVWLGFVDQEASLELARLTRVLAGQFERLRPEVVITQPYEGGHPDHDATAFAVHSACGLLCEQTGSAPAILEMTAYHNRAGAMATAAFLPLGAGKTVRLELSPLERAFKQRLFDCFQTQQRVLQYFPIGSEPFRVAPQFDFGAPPHQGRLYYELFDWGMDGARWGQLARQAAGALGPNSLMDLTNHTKPPLA